MTLGIASGHQSPEEKIRIRILQGFGVFTSDLVGAASGKIIGGCRLPAPNVVQRAVAENTMPMVRFAAVSPSARMGITSCHARKRGNSRDIE